MHVGQGRMLGAIVNHPPPSLLREPLSLEPELTRAAGLANQLAPGICFFSRHLTWVLRIRTLVLTLAHLACDSLSHLPGPGDATVSQCCDLGARPLMRRPSGEAPDSNTAWHTYGEAEPGWRRPARKRGPAGGQMALRDLTVGSGLHLR